MTKEEETPISYPVSGGQQTELKPLVSVIVPVYNVEPYLHRCIDSLVHQTLKDIEIILIDDGSTDGCGKICDAYAAADARISVVHQENAGLSEARNAGIDRARADYLMFVDSDDWVETEFCEIPYTLAKEQHADLVMFQFRYIRHGKNTRHYPRISDGVKSTKESLCLVMSGADMRAYNKLYHRILFTEHRYPKGMVYEDIVLTPVLINSAKRIFYTSVTLYNQVYRAGSITNIVSEKNAKDLYDAICLTSQHIKEWGYNEESDFFYQTRMLHYIAISPHDSNELIEYFRGLRQCPPHFSWRRKIMFFLLVLSPCLYRTAYRVYGKLFQ